MNSSWIEEAHSFSMELDAEEVSVWLPSNWRFGKEIS